MIPSRNPVNTRAAERAYASALRSVGREVGKLIRGFDASDPAMPSSIARVMRQYSDLLRPWAERTGRRMLETVNLADLRTWKAVGKELAAGIVDTVENTPVGDAFLTLLARQVDLIQSIPLDAAMRVHALTVTALEDSTRASEIAEEIRRSGDVSENKAILIARTEVARTASTLMQARAVAVGAQSYVWETSRDGDVRPSHRKMQGKTIDWDAPPELDGMTGHAGEFPNCRCWPRVILPKVDKRKADK